MTKKIAIAYRKELRAEANNNSESSDYTRGILAAAIILHDILQDEGKHVVAEIIEQV